METLKEELREIKATKSMEIGQEASIRYQEVPGTTTKEKEGKEMTLTLTQMGCTIREEAQSNCKSYRLRIPEIRTKDGRTVSGDFHRGARYDFTKKKPRKVSDWQIFTDLQYTDADGMTWRYTPDGQGGMISNYRSVQQSPFYGKDYTLETILEIVNSMAAEPFDAVEVA